MGKAWVRPAKVAEDLDYSLAHVYALVAQGELVATKRGNTMRISWASVQDFLNRYLVSPTEAGKNF